MTAAQRKKYWREWSAVRRKIGDEATDELRHDLHVRALGKDKSSVRFTNKDFDAVLREFRAISLPADMDAQLRLMNQERKRLLYKISMQKKLLAVFVEKPEAYVASLLNERFRGRAAEDLEFRAEGDRTSEMMQLIMTLAARIDRFRRDAGLTNQEMEYWADNNLRHYERPAFSS